MICPREFRAFRSFRAGHTFRFPAGREEIVTETEREDSRYSRNNISHKIYSNSSIENRKAELVGSRNLPHDLGLFRGLVTLVPPMYSYVIEYLLSTRSNTKRVVSE